MEKHWKYSQMQMHKSENGKKFNIGLSKSLKELERRSQLQLDKPRQKLELERHSTGTRQDVHWKETQYALERI